MSPGNTGCFHALWRGYGFESSFSTVVPGDRRHHGRGVVVVRCQHRSRPREVVLLRTTHARRGHSAARRGAEETP